MKKHFSIQESIRFGVSTFCKRPWFFIQLTLLSFFCKLYSFNDYRFFIFPPFFKYGPLHDFAYEVIRAIFYFWIFSLFIFRNYPCLLLVVNGHNLTTHDLFTIKKELFIQYIFLWIMMAVFIVLGFLLLLSRELFLP